MPEPVINQPDHFEPGRTGGHTALLGRRRAPLAGRGQLPGGRPRSLLPRAGCVHPRGEGGVPQLRGAGRLPRVRTRARREVRDLGRPLGARAPAGTAPTGARAPGRDRRLRRGESRLDRLLRTDPGPLEELLVAPRELVGGEQADELHCATRRDRLFGPVPERRRTQLADRCAADRRGSSKPAPVPPTGARNPARARREVRRHARGLWCAMRERDAGVVGLEHAVHRDHHRPNAHRHRAQTRVRSVRADVGRDER